MIVDEGPTDEVLAAARELAARADGVPVGRAELLRTLSGTWIAIGERTVAKVHLIPAGVPELAARLALAADPRLSGCVLAPAAPRPLPLTPEPVQAWATLWPRIDPLPADVAAAPWTDAGALLAGLHRVPLVVDGRPTIGSSATGLPVAGLPRQGSVDRLRTALARLDRVTGGIRVPTGLVSAVRAVRSAAARLPAASWSVDGGPGRPRTLVHGDWHLGQLGRLRTGQCAWRLIDVDDLGLGDPAWDLGRPAAFWAAGLMPDADWHALVAAYRTAGGPALPASPAGTWAALDAVAQACVVLAAAGAVRRAVLRGGGLEDVDERMVEVCAGLPGGSG